MSDKEKIERLEMLVVFLAQGILSHEYGKDLSHYGVERVLRELAYSGVEDAGDIALSIAEENE